MAVLLRRDFTQIQLVVEGDVRMACKFYERYKNIIWLTLTVIGSLFLCFYAFDLWEYNFDVPLMYNDGDYLSHAMIVKRVVDGTLLEDWRLGAPYSGTFFDYPLYGDVLNFGIIKVFSLLGFSWGKLVNLYYCFTFIAISGASYWVLKEMRISYNLVACLGALSFTAIPYHFLRNTLHLFLSMYVSVPLSVLIIYWLMSDKEYWRFDKRFWKTPKNILTIFILIVIATTGIYYAFFACFFFGITMLIRVIKEEKKWQCIVQSVTHIAVIGCCVILAAIPWFCSSYFYGKSAEVTQRNPLEAEYLSLKITQLVFPNKTHGISFLEELLSDYAAAPVPNEGSEYLGVMGVIGFLLSILIVVLGVKVKNNVSWLAKLNLSAVLLATVGGGGSIFALLVSAQIRAYNRISVFIAWFSIALVCGVVTDVLDKCKIAVYKKTIYVIVGALLVVGLREQIIVRTQESYAASVSDYYSDEAFIKQIEESVSPEAMIYQLPYHAFPETANKNKMGDYALLRGYLHSDTLRWSYGEHKGREGDLWNRNLSSQNIGVIINTITSNGFEGIYIDTFAYTNEALAQLKGEIEAITGASAIHSDNGRLLFYNLQEYNELKWKYALGEILTPDKIGAFSLLGMSGSEKTHVWTDGTEVEMKFLIDGKFDNLDLVMNTIPLLTIRR